LVNLARDEGTSIVITTHYIEEARQANRVGLVRNGALLAQASPESLLLAHRLPTLEDVFLKLCQSVEGLGGRNGHRVPNSEGGFLAEQRAKNMKYNHRDSPPQEDWALVPAASRRSGSSDSSREAAFGDRHYYSSIVPPNRKGSDVGRLHHSKDNPVFTLSGEEITTSTAKRTSYGGSRHNKSSMLPGQSGPGLFADGFVSRTFHN
jgi:ABC-type glutathione transport system ATPase component